MSTPSLTTIAQQVTIYFGTFMLIIGLIGAVLTLIIFLSLKTFRENSCAFYLTAMSFANIFQLLFSLLSYILISGYGIDWSSYSMTYCKFRTYFIQLCLLSSLTCMCLATVDQYLATCFNPRWHRWNNIKYARYTLAVCFFIWLLHGIPFLMYYNLIQSPTNPNKTACKITNPKFQQYATFGYIFILMGILPLIIMVLFGISAYYNVRNLAYRTVPLVRRELDKQITQIVLVQVIYGVIVLTPYAIGNIVIYILPSSNITVFINNLIIIIHNLHFASSFYIYFCVSKRFRQQFYHVFFNIHLNRWIQPNINRIQVVPQQPNSSNNNN